MGEELEVRLMGDVTDLVSVTVVDSNGGREVPLLDDGAVERLDVAAFVSGRNRMIPSSLQIELSKAFLVEERMTLTLPLQLAPCLGTCENRIVRVPDLGNAFSRNEVRRRCGQGGGATFSQRTETLLFCQAAHLFQLQRGEGGREMSDIALNGWYRAAFELHSFHQMQGVRFVGRDENVERRVLLRITNGQYRQRVGLTPDVFERERDNLGSLGRESLRYIEVALRQHGPQSDLQQWVEEITDLFLATVTSSYPPSESDFRLLAAVRTLANLPPIE
jgi:hypothetical protein